MSRTSISILSAAPALLVGSAVVAGPVPLTDSALDRVTAGTASELQGSGGAIVGNDSEAVLVLTGTLELADDAQSGARGLNVVNSSESTVANGVNVWDGQIPDSATKDPAPKPTGEFSVSQENAVYQEQRRVSLLPSYERSGANRSSSWDEDSTESSTTSSLMTNEALDLETTNTTRDLTATGSVDTNSSIVGQEIKAGKGIAGAGDLHVNFDAGTLTYRVDGSVNVGGTMNTTTTAIPDEGTTTTQNQNATDGVIVSGSLLLTLELPELVIDFNGAGCAVMMGSCSSAGTLDETSETVSDHSVITSTDTTQESDATFVGGGSEEIRAAFTLEDAQAEYIVVDDSSLDVEANYGISLAGAAQADLRALNAVNAAGSAVANAVNISRTPSLSAAATMALVQSNVIRHSR
jgi:hypothetical protein